MGELGDRTPLKRGNYMIADSIGRQERGHHGAGRQQPHRVRMVAEVRPNYEHE